MQSYHRRGSQGSSLSSTLVLIISPRESSVQCCRCEMYRPHVKDSGFLPSWFFPLEIGIRENFSCGIQNPTNDWNPENKFHQQKTCTVCGIRNPRRGIQNPTVHWIPSHGAKASCRSLIQKKKIAKRKSKKQNTLIWQTAPLRHNGS